MKAGYRVICNADRGTRYRLVSPRGAEEEDVGKFLCALEVRGLSPKTVRAYCYDLLTLYRWLGDENTASPRSVEELKQSDLLEYVRFQRVSNASPTSINRRLVVIGLFYRFVTGCDIGAVSTSGAGASVPAPYYKGRGRDRNLGLHRIASVRHRSLRVKTPRKVVEPLTAEQVRHLLARFTRYRDLCIAYMMLLSGLRSREVLALEIGDVDNTENRLRVSGKGGKERVLPLPSLIMNYLRDYLRLERPSVCRTKALFVVLQGKRRGFAMTPDGMRSLFRHRRRDPALENANPHSLRHTFGADMARAGVRLPVLQRMMGHEDSKMTLHYINLSMSDVASEFRRAAAEIHKRYIEEEPPK
jgi:site-specific recombinase XerD